MKCPKCGELVLRGSSFCDVCGAKIVKDKKCSCGTKCDGQFNFCPKCGKSFETGLSSLEAELEKEKKQKFSEGVKDMEHFLEENLENYDEYVNGDEDEYDDDDD